MAYENGFPGELPTNYRQTDSRLSAPIVTVSDDQFLEMVGKTWLQHFQNASGMSEVEILPAYPDDTTKMKWPSLVMSRVGDDKMTLARNNGYYGVASGLSASAISVIKGLRYEATYQFDLYTRNIRDQMKYEAVIASSLRRRADLLSEDAFGWTQIPVMDYSNYPSGVVATSYCMALKLHKDVESTRVENPFDTQIHQTAFSVHFVCDLLREENSGRILCIATSGIELL